MAGIYSEAAQVIDPFSGSGGSLNASQDSRKNYHDVEGTTARDIGTSIH